MININRYEYSKEYISYILDSLKLDPSNFYRILLKHDSVEQQIGLGRTEFPL